MTEDKILNVLFLCTGNSARSIIAECIVNRDGQDRFRAFSAGSHPAGRINKDALSLLDELGFSDEGLRSKSWDEFAQAGAPKIDVVISVCANAAAETCPNWPGHPLSASWAIPDPAAIEGDASKRRDAFHRAYSALQARVHRLMALPIDNLNSNRLGQCLTKIGRTEP